jgi:urease accessory protein
LGQHFALNFVRLDGVGFARAVDGRALPPLTARHARRTDFAMDNIVDRFAADAPTAVGRQRARGEVRATFARAGARTEAAAVFETGGLRVRFPRAGGQCEAVIVNTGGGMAGGDRMRTSLSLSPGARVLATTQSAEKIYRADGVPTEVDLRLRVEAGAALVWAPQETLLFEDARLSRRLEADVATDGSLLIVEAAVFGRLAHGEARIDASFRDDWRVRRDGRLVFADAVRLENAGASLDRPAVGGGARAIATLLYVDPLAPTQLDGLRAALDAVAQAPGEGLEAGASVVDGALIARMLSPAPGRVRAALIAALRVLRGQEAPRVWQ